MGLLKKFFMIVGIVVTVLVLLLILLIGALALIKPYGINIGQLLPSILSNNPITSSYDHPYLTDQQESVLKSIGINPQDIPTTITSAQRQCATDILGKEKVDAIVSGNMPSITDVLKVKQCFE